MESNCEHSMGVISDSIGIEIETYNLIYTITGSWYAIK